MAGRTVAEAQPQVGDRFRLSPHDNAWWEVKEVKERGVVIELWSTHGHLTLWENQLYIYPI